MSDRAQRPFWLHQLTEYVIGFALIVFGFQDPDPVVPAVVGVLVLVNAAVVDGPLGAFKFIGRRVHKWLDVVVMVLLVVAAVQGWVDASPLGRFVIVALIVPYAFLWWYTDWEPRAGRRARREAAAADGRGEDLGRSAGRAAANAYLAGKRVIKKQSGD